MSLIGARSKYYFYNTMVCLIKALEEKVITVEIRNNIVVTGKLSVCDSAMGLELTDVTWMDVAGHRRRFDKFFVRGRQIVYIHIPDEVNILKAMHWQLNKAEYFQAKQDNLRKKTFDRKRMMQEKSRQKFERRERSAGPCPNRGGGRPGFQGNAPHNQGNIPHNQGNAPYKQWHVPHNQGNIPHNQGNVPHNQGNVPHNQGNVPSTQWNVPHNQGNVPHNQFGQFKHLHEKDDRRLQVGAGSSPETFQERGQLSPYTNIKTEGSLQREKVRDGSLSERQIERGGSSHQERGSLRQDRRQNSPQTSHQERGSSGQERRDNSQTSHQERERSRQERRDNSPQTHTYVERGQSSHQERGGSRSMPKREEMRPSLTPEMQHERGVHLLTRVQDITGSSFERHPEREDRMLPRHNKKDDTLFQKSIKKEFRSAELLGSEEVRPRKSQSYWDNESKPSSSYAKPHSSFAKDDHSHQSSEREGRFPKQNEDREGFDLRDNILNRGNKDRQRQKEREARSLQRRDERKIFDNRRTESSQGLDRRDRMQPSDEVQFQQGQDMRRALDRKRAERSDIKKERL